MLEDGGAEDTMSLRSREKMRMRKISVEAGNLTAEEEDEGKTPAKGFLSSCSLRPTSDGHTGHQFRALLRKNMSLQVLAYQSLHNDHTTHTTDSPKRRRILSSPGPSLFGIIYGRHAGVSQ